MFGVTPTNFDINSSLYNKCGWHIFCYLNYSNPVLYSGPPHNFNGKKTNFKIIKDEIILIMNMNKKTLKFIIDNEEYEAYTNIPTDIKITPSVFLYNIDDSVEIIEC